MNKDTKYYDNPAFCVFSENAQFRKKTANVRTHWRNKLYKFVLNTFKSKSASFDMPCVSAHRTRKSKDIDTIWINIGLATAHGDCEHALDPARIFADKSGWVALALLYARLLQALGEREETNPETATYQIYWPLAGKILAAATTPVGYAKPLYILKDHDASVAERADFGA